MSTQGRNPRLAFGVWPPMSRPLILVVLAAALATACQAPVEDAITLRGVATAGPVCPVETNPPDPNCEDRPVSDAEIVVRNADGELVARVRTGEDGTFAVSLAPGRYELVPQDVNGMMGTAGPIAVTLTVGQVPDEVIVSYDTGIR